MILRAKEYVYHHLSIYTFRGKCKRSVKKCIKQQERIKDGRKYEKE